MRTRRAIGAFATSVAFMVVTLLIGIISTPIFLRLLGDERVGAFRVATDWAAYLILLELGLSGSLRARFAKATSQSLEATGGVFGAGVVAYRRVTVWMILAAVLFAVALPWFIPVVPALRSELLIAWALLGATSLTLLLGPIRPLLEGMQYGYVINKLLILQSLILTTTGIGFAWMGWGIISQALGTLLGAVFLAGGMFWYLRRIAPALSMRLWRPQSDASERAYLAKLNLPTFASSLSGLVGVMSDNIIIGFLLGPPAVVPFFLTQRIALVAQGLLQSLSGSSWAGLADLYHRQQCSMLQTRVVELTRLIAMVSVVTLAPILVFNGSFVSLWVGGDRFGGEWMTLLAVIDALLLAIVSLWGLLFSGTEKIALVAPVSVVSAILNVTVSFLATYFIGLEGPLLGTFVALTLVQFVWIPRLMKLHFGISPTQIFSALVYPWLLSCPIILLFWFTMRSYPSVRPDNWLGLVLAVGLMSSVLLLLQWRLSLDAEHRHLWRRRLIDFAKR